MCISDQRATRSGRRARWSLLRSGRGLNGLGGSCLGLLLLACSTAIDDPEGAGDSTSGKSGTSAGNGGVLPGAGSGAGAMSGSSEGGSGVGTAGNNTGGPGAGGSGAVGAGPSAGTGSAPVDGPASLLPARIRRLSNAEYDASVNKLLGTSQKPASGSDFPPDFRQNGFTVNEAQRVDSVIVQRLAAAADALATEAAQNGTLARLAPCSDPGQAENCARTFITTFGSKVYRRALVDEEITALLELYRVGAEDASYEEGIAHTLRGLLQSAGFLYLTELGDGTPLSDGSIALTAHELAASLSYLLTSAPPDDALLEKAVAGALADPAVREAEARRLLKDEPLAQETTIRFVREWLGIDRIAGSAKDTVVYPEFEQHKAKIVAESVDFVRAVTFQSAGTVSELLGADWTVASGPLGLYQTAGNGPIGGTTKLTDRVGILNQAAFLATYANAHESHPVLRGVAIARRVACLNTPSPAALNIQVVPPVPDPSKTTRERFDVHSQDAECAGCHRVIDPFGFAFEHFDGMGAYRSQENGKPIDSAVVVTTGSDFDGTYSDSNELARALAESPAVRACFARFVFRAASASGDAALRPSEDAFVAAWQAIPEAAQGNIVETLLAYVKSPSFAARRAQ